MLNIVFSNRFKKDLKTISKRNYALNLLEEVVNTLAKQKPYRKRIRITRSLEITLVSGNATFNQTGCWFIGLKMMTLSSSYSEQEHIQTYFKEPTQAPFQILCSRLIS